MMMMTNEIGETIGGYLEHKDGMYVGKINIEGIDLSPIVGMYFKEDGVNWLWVRRKDTMEYDSDTQQYTKRKAQPYWECYLKKQGNGMVAYKGNFIFSHFKFEMTGVWDKYMRDVDRLNFFIKRLPRQEQTIINNINQRNQERNEKRL